jgi:hypothetical protein
MVRQSGFGMLMHGAFGLGPAWFGLAWPARLVQSRQIAVGQGRRGSSSRDLGWQVMARLASAGVGMVRQGTASHGMDGLAGLVGLGPAWRVQVGSVGHGGAGALRRAWAGQGTAGLAWLGKSRLVVTWHGGAGEGSPVLSNHGRG